MTEFLVNIPNSNYIKQFNEFQVYQGHINPLTKLPNGKGRIKYLTSGALIDTYEGDFNEGELSGQGTVIYKNTNKYIGQLLNSKRNGFGSMYTLYGKYLYDGYWISDNIDKPIYTKLMVNGLLSFQGLKTHDVFNGWCVLHNNNGLISNMSFYQDGVSIKGFEVTEGIGVFNFKIQKSSKINEIGLIKFMVELVDKLSKPDNLVNFLSESINIETLENMSYLYQQGTTKMLEGTSYLIGDNDSLIEEMHYVGGYCVRVIYCQESIIIGLYNKETMTFEDSLKYKAQCLKTKTKQFKKKNNPSSESDSDQESDTEEDNKNNMSINISYFETDKKLNYSISNLILIESGTFIFNENDDDRWILNGQGYRKKINNCEYTGKFIQGLFSEGTEIKKNIKQYEGKFNINERYEGMGTMYHPNGMIKYQGEHHNGKSHGCGSSYYKNDENIEAIEYVGLWFKGEKQGLGTLFSVGGDEIYTGNFNGDQIA